MIQYLMSKIFCSYCGTETAGEFYHSECRATLFDNEETFNGMGNKNNIPTIPTRPSHQMVDEPLPECDPRWDKYHRDRQALSMWVKSPALASALVEAVRNNDLRTYVQLEKLWIYTAGCGSKKWREMVAALL